MGKDKVSEFYDDYVLKQAAKGYNERHILLNNYLIKLGLNINSSVLELGCGIGTITSLFTKLVNKGKIVVVDISEESIKYSKRINTNENIEFVVSDLASFEYKDYNFDYVTLFDVLEHVPVDQHRLIFKKITSLMDEKSRLVIHIPTKENINYVEKNTPELMQIIDQPLSELKMIQDATKEGLRLEKFEFTNIWEQYDYQLFVFVKQFEFDKTKKIEHKVKLIDKVKRKLK